MDLNDWMDMSPMKVHYASTEEEVKELQDKMMKEGLMLAAVSNTGLKEGFRLTFLPKSAFKDLENTG